MDANQLIAVDCKLNYIGMRAAFGITDGIPMRFCTAPRVYTVPCTELELSNLQIHIRA